MEIEERVVVVTGAGSGIGRALAKEFVSAGARVVAADIDGGAAEATVAELAHGRARAAAVDTGTTDGIGTLIELARNDFGPVDIYVANAGVWGPTLLGDEEGWERTLHVNLLGHIRAAQQLMPDWQARSEGHFVSVASAAGLLTQPGGAAYAVTKHAAVAFAEWLAITYGDNGIGVTCVCPLGVNTPLLDAGRRVTDAAARLAFQAVVNSGPVIEPQRVAEMTLDAVRTGTFMVLPHPEVADMFSQRASDHDRWMAGMRHYQRSLAGG